MVVVAEGFFVFMGEIGEFDTEMHSGVFAVAGQIGNGKENEFEVYYEMKIQIHDIPHLLN